MTGAKKTACVQGARAFGQKLEHGDPSRIAWKQATLCCVKAGVVSRMHVKRDADGRYKIVSSTPDIRDQFSRSTSSIVVGILPKRYYLTRTLTIPDAEPDDVRAMLSLEAVTPLQPEFGPAEVAYRKLSDCGAGSSRYEVYIARDVDVEQCMRVLAEAGSSPSILIPSAVAWRDFFPHTEGSVDICMAGSLEEAREAAIWGPDDSVVVRATPRGAQGDGGHLRFFHECIREAKARMLDSRADVQVGVLGGADTIEAGVADQGVHVCDPVPATVVAEVRADSLEPLLVMAGVALGESWPCRWAATDLTPRRVVYARRRKVMGKRLFSAVGLILCSLGILLAACKVAITRYDRHRARLDAEIRQIKTVGESIEHKRAQLAAIQRTQASRGYMYDVIAGLYAATPEGVSYSQVNLTRDLELRIRGQAKSASLPFLLPERFERSGVFEQVVLRGVGQKSQGAGSVTQFDLECRFRGGTQR